MTSTCTICRHPQALLIDRDMKVGVPYRKVASTYGVNTRSLQRHVRNHLPLVVERQRIQRAAEVLVSGEWQALKRAIVQALAPYPDARAAVLGAITESADEPGAGFGAGIAEAGSGVVDQPLRQAQRAQSQLRVV